MQGVVSEDRTVGVANEAAPDIASQPLQARRLSSAGADSAALLADMRIQAGTPGGAGPDGEALRGLANGTAATVSAGDTQTTMRASTPNGAALLAQLGGAVVADANMEHAWSSSAAGAGLAYLSRP